jgi:hypothetical protein
MLASELIRELTDAVEEHGDMPVQVWREGAFTDIWVVADPADEWEREEGIEGSIDIHFD